MDLGIVSNFERMYAELSRLVGSMLHSAPTPPVPPAPSKWRRFVRIGIDGGVSALALWLSNKWGLAWYDQAILTIFAGFCVDFVFRKFWPKPEPAPAPAGDDKVGAYWLLYWLGLIALAGAWYLAGRFLTDTTFIVFGTELNAGYLVWTLGALHFAGGFQIVPIDEYGGVFLFGIPTIALSGKPVVVPFGVFTLRRVTKRVIEVEFPDDPEKVYRGDDPKVPDGLKPPIRIPFANPKRGDTSGIDPTDPLHRRSTNEVSFFVRYQVDSVFDFLVHIGNTDLAKQQLEDMGVSVLNDELTQLTPAEALTKLSVISGLLEQDIRARTKNWGVNIHNARIKLIEFSHNLNSSIQGIPQAGAEAQAVVLRAEGEKTKRTREGEGSAAALKADLTERAAGLKKMAEDLGVDTSVVIAAETARTIGQSASDKIIVGTQGFADMLGIGTAIAGVIKPKPAVPALPTPTAPPAGGTT